MDWYRWHEGYREGGRLRERLALVVNHVVRAIESAPPGPIRIISFCAGQGHDLVGALGASARAEGVAASASFARHGFATLASDPDDRFGVTSCVLEADSQPYRSGVRMFEFAGEQTLIDLGRVNPPG